MVRTKLAFKPFMTAFCEISIPRKLSLHNGLRDIKQLFPDNKRFIKRYHLRPQSIRKTSTLSFEQDDTIKFVDTMLLVQIYQLSERLITRHKLKRGAPGNWQERSKSISYLIQCPATPVITRR